jgi:hypothetical protein
MKIEMKDLYWLAGLIEGEGCFTTSGKNKPTIPVLKIRMNDRDVIERAQRILTPLTHRKNSNPVRLIPPYRRSQAAFITVISGRGAIGWMMTLYPLMGERRQARIRELLAAWLTSPSRYAKSNAVEEEAVCV